MSVLFETQAAFQYSRPTPCNGAVMFQWLRSSPQRMPNTQSLRGAPQELSIEIQLQEELHACASRADWRGLLIRLESLETKVPILGSAAVTSIANSRMKGDGPTLLHLVCGREFSRELARTLLRLGADPNASSYTRDVKESAHMLSYASPIFWAISQGDKGVVKELLKHGADVNFRNKLGETPLMFLTSATPSHGNWLPVRALLLKAGADVSATTHQGRSPLSHHILHGEWEHARDLVQREATLASCSKDVISAVVKKLKQFGAKVCEAAEEDSRKFRIFIDVLEGLAPALSWGDLFAILNHGRDRQPGFFGHMLMGGCSPMLMERAVRLGGSIAHACDVEMVGQKLQNVRPLHLAILSGNVELVEKILRRWRGADLHELVGPQKLNPLHLLYVGDKQPNHHLSRLLLEWGVDPHHRSADGASLLDKAIASKDVAGMHLWAECDSNPFALSSSLVQQIGWNDPEVRAKKRQLLRFAELRASLPRFVEQELFLYAGEQPRSGFSPRAQEYLSAYHVAVEPTTWRASNTELYKILPRILLSQKPPPVVQIFRAIDRLNDTNEHARGFHPYEADMMAILAQPGRSVERSELVRSVVLALTSVHRFLNVYIDKVPTSTVALWGRIGVLGLSFRAWKWDTQRIAFGENQVDSLFEQFGFVRCAGEEDESSMFGTTFVLSHDRKESMKIEESRRDGHGLFDPLSHIEFRHGFVLVSHPTKGTLIVRNSSPIFGRDLLQYPAYYSRLSKWSGLSGELLCELTPNVIEGGFIPILHSSLYAPRYSALPEIEFLLSQIEQVRTSYAAWKFDSDYFSAWDRIEGVGTALRGGYYSDGFSGLVRHLKRLVVAAEGQGKRPPELAFFSRLVPPWVPLRFSDLDGKEYATLSLDLGTIALLEKLATSSATRNDFKNDNGRAFEFFQKGLDEGAELMIVDSKGETYGL
jgi:hypothetical protein